jgi:hypothetical protein
MSRASSVDALTPFYLLDNGSYIAVSPAEKRAGSTPSYALSRGRSSPAERRWRDDAVP